MLFQPEQDILLIAGSGAVLHVPAAVFKSSGIISRRHIPVPGNGTEVDLKLVCSTGFGESHGFEFLNFVIHVPINHLSLPPIECQIHSIRVLGKALHFVWPKRL